MRAVLCKSWGEPEKLIVEEVRAPAPGPDEVRLRVHACGINFGDVLMVQGKYQVKPAFPFTPGFEIAGEVLECGEEVTGRAPGDRVIGFPLHGGYAEQAVVRADGIVPIPDAMDYVSAAAFPVAYGTSHVALARCGRLAEGETLLVMGAAGGVGLTAIEIGKTMGAIVIAAAGGPDKLEIAKQHGADHLIDYDSEDLRARIRELTDGRGADVIYDPVGGDYFDTALRCLAWEGRILVIGFASGRIPEIPANRLLLKSAQAIGVYWGAYRQNDPSVIVDSFETLMGWYEEGKLKPHVSHTFDIADVGEAMRMLLERRSTGKVVLTTGAD